VCECVESEGAPARVCERKRYGRWENVNLNFNHLLTKTSFSKIVLKKSQKTSIDPLPPSPPNKKIFGGEGCSFLWASGCIPPPPKSHFFTLCVRVLARASVFGVGVDHNSAALFIIVRSIG